MKFSDGTPFTAEDVVFTYDRVPKVPNSPSPFTLYLGSVAKTEAVDPMTLRITTKDVAPNLLVNLAQLPIMSKKAASGPAAEGKTTTELNNGDGLVGTGPTSSCPGSAAPSSCWRAMTAIGARSPSGTR